MMGPTNPAKFWQVFSSFNISFLLSLDHKYEAMPALALYVVAKFSKACV